MGELEAQVVQPGWEVYGNDGERVGVVDEVDPEAFTMELEILGGSAVRVPFSSIVAADDGRVEIDLPSQDVGVGTVGPEPPPG
jgi:sporulation protein YlmC with PRC-barrel domain